MSDGVPVRAQSHVSKKRAGKQQIFTEVTPQVVVDRLSITRTSSSRTKQNLRGKPLKT